jgi:hypothetical protein
LDLGNALIFILEAATRTYPGSTVKRGQIAIWCAISALVPASA